MQTITVTTILQKIRDVLAASSTIAEWSLSEFGKTPTIYVGYDLKKPPTEDTMPHIILLPLPKEEGVERESHVYHVLVAWCIKDEAVVSATADGEDGEDGEPCMNTVEYSGIYTSDEFGQMIWSCLAEMSSNIPSSRVEYDLDGSVMVPLFPGYMTIEFDVSVLIGGADPEF